MANKRKKQRTRGQKITRRAFMALGGLVGGGLVVGAGGLVYITKAGKKYSGKGFEGNQLNAWISVLPDNTILVAVPRSEMGQGVNTSLPMLVAEELEVEMSAIKIVQPQPEGPYANSVMLTHNPRTDLSFGSTFDMSRIMDKVTAFLPLVATGGSTSIVDGYNVMRCAGAVARESLIQAAAKKWDVDASGLYAEKGHVINKATKEKLTYGELSEVASTIEIKKVPELKAQKDFKIIGTPVARYDIPGKVNGSAKFGLDVRESGMLYGAVRHATYRAGEITAIKNQADIEKRKGIKKVILLPKGIGAVVVADNTWRAINASKALRFEETGDKTISSQGVAKQAASILDESKMIATPLNKGNVDDVFAKGEGIIEARYDVPYLAHACMEPLNCTVLVKDGTATAWVGSQGSSLVLDAVNASTGIDKDKITVNITYLGGGFGRRAEIDFITHAGYVAKEMEGTPVQVMWSREEATRFDMFRPYVLSNFKAAINAAGEIEAWENKIALQSVANNATTRIKPAFAPAPKDDLATPEGAADLPYAMNNAKMAFGQIDSPIQVGNWRSVGNSYNGFFTESFMDECAKAAGKDPYEFRKSKLGKKSRFAAVLDKVAEISNWKTPLAEGKFRGIAMQKSFGSIVAEVAEITKVGDKEFSIDNFYCVIDCGRIVNPDTVEAQMQSGIIYGITAAMYGEITFNEGEVEQYNFPQYEMVRLKTAPRMKVHIMKVDKYPGGVGEPGTPPAPAALANALFAATGERIRSLPFSKHGYKFV